jgi:hypothetical protein
MELALRARVDGLTVDAIDRLRIDQRSVVRTWGMRSTLHLLPTADLEWMLATLDPANLKAAWRWLEKRAGLDRTRSAAMLEAACALLQAHGPLPRRELMARVSEVVGFDTQPAAAGAMLLGGLLGRICFGPDRGSKPTYAALDHWLGQPIDISRSPELTRLARSFLTGYGPAGPRDLAAWWGMPISQARAAWENLKDELTVVEVDGENLSELKGASTPEIAHSVRLIPAFDTYLLGYDRRDFAVPRGLQGQVFHGGQIAPVILVDGLAVGTWRYAQHAGKIRINATPFSEFSSPVREGIAAEAEDIGRFYGLKQDLVFSKLAT